MAVALSEVGNQEAKALCAAAGVGVVVGEANQP